jgi:hypothetical protein
MRSVTTHIYTSINSEVVVQHRANLSPEERRQLMQDRHQVTCDWESTMCRLCQVLDGEETVDPAMERTEADTLRAELQRLMVSAEEIEDQILGLEDGGMHMTTERFLQRTQTFKMQPMPTWEKLPDQVVYDMTHGEAQAK